MHLPENTDAKAPSYSAKIIASAIVAGASLIGFAMGGRDAFWLLCCAWVSGGFLLNSWFSGRPTAFLLSCFTSTARLRGESDADA